jgi:arylsulfatase A-like enzyme
VRPNILYLHSHDTGRFVQPYGHAVPTPNIQLLADQGVLFREAFCAAPTCSGSRASLLTGQYPHTNGMMGLAHRGFRLNDYDEHLAVTLGSAGYRTELIGEQHISPAPDDIGYQVVHPIETNHVERVAPVAIQTLTGGIPEPFFLSVGFFETHRSFFEPTSVRDTLYSLPPANLPDTPEVRADVAGYKASARTLDHAIGSVLNALHVSGLAERTLVVCTTDHGLAFPGAKGTLSDRGIGVMLLMRGPGGFTGGKVVDELVSHVDLYPTLCELAEVETPPFAQGVSLLPLVRGEAPAARDAVYAELTYHAAYDPQRAVRTKRWKYVRRFADHPPPVLVNVDDSPTKELLLREGWGHESRGREQLFDLVLDPAEARNVAGDPAVADVCEELSAKLDDWMRATDDPLLHGPIAPPATAALNLPGQRSASEPTFRGGDPAVKVTGDEGRGPVVAGDGAPAEAPASGTR